MLELVGETLAAAERRVAKDRAAIEARDLDLARRSERIDELERVSIILAERVVERERELKQLRAELAVARAVTPGSAASEEWPPRARAEDERIPVGSNGHRAGGLGELFEGIVEVEIGPLSDFSQLVGFEDAAGGIAATSEISVKRFTKGRATLSVRFEEPVALLRELEERAPFEFRVRDLRSDRLVLDVDE